MVEENGFANIMIRDNGVHVAVWSVYELHTAFQPVFRFNRDAKLSITAYEGLVRPFREGRPVSPYRFFSGVAPEDRFEVEKLTRNLHLLNAGACLNPKVRVFVNIDPSLFASRRDIDLTLRDMHVALKHAGLDPARIVCELTEQKSASERVLSMLITAFRSNGISIAVDDFGADDSDFERILNLKPDIVKFDGDWVARLMKSAAGYTLLKTMIGRVASLNMETVIEGIEEGWQLELTEKSGAEMVQGFGVARPQIVQKRLDSLVVNPGDRTCPETGFENPFDETIAISANAQGHVRAFGRRR